MRVMVFVKGDPGADDDPSAAAGGPEVDGQPLPSEELVEAMTRFNEELVANGVMLAGDGLHPSSKGVRVRFDGSRRTVIDGPFSESKELVAGYWIWQVRSMDEAVEWLKKAPFDGGAEVEIRPIFESEDFLENYDPSLREREDRLKAAIAERA
jgi:hypothetical protein